MRRQDYFRQERQGWLRLHEKGGTRHDVPAHHRAAAEALDDYLEAAGLDEPTAALFQSVDPAGRRLTGRTDARPEAESATAGFVWRGRSIQVVRLRLVPPGGWTFEPASMPGHWFRVE